MSIMQVYLKNTELQALSNISPNKLRFLLYLHDNWFSKYPEVSASQETFAKDMGVERETINRWLKELHALKAIQKTRTIINKFATCQYKATLLLRKNLYRLREINVMFKYAALTISISTAVSEPRITPYKDIKGEETRSCYSSLQVLLKNPSPIKSKANPNMRARDATKQKSDKEAMKERVMTDITARNAINEIKTLKLTQWGVIRLHAFSDRVIRYAENQMRSSNPAKLRDPYGLFVKFCFDESKRTGDKVHNDYIQQIYREYNAPYDREYIEKTEIGLDGLDKKKVDKHESVSSEALVLKKEAYEERHAKLLADEREKMRAKQRAWEAANPEKFKANLQKVLPDMHALMEHVGASKESLDVVTKFATTEKETVEVKRQSITAEAIEHYDKIFETIKKFRLQRNLNEFSRIVLHNFEVQLEEAKTLYDGAEEWWSFDVQEPLWGKDQSLIDWAIQFLDHTLKQSYSNEWYVNLKAEIEQGPESTRAKSRELQEGLALMQSLLKKEKSVSEEAALKKEGRSDPEAQTVGDGVHHTNGAHPLEENRMQFQQESILRPAEAGEDCLRY